MGYTGRIWAQVFVFTCFGTCFLFDIEDESRNLHHLLWRIGIWGMSSVVAWLFGRAYDKISMDARYDLITGSLNRRYAMQIIPHIFQKVKSRGQRCSLFILDGNGLKYLNDTFGHAYGDEAIKEIAMTLRRILPSEGLVTRMGGDEFLCVLPGMGSAQAAALVNMLESSIADASRAKTFSISVSAGYAVYPDDGLDIGVLLEIADSRMYARKNEAYQNRQEIPQTEHTFD